MQILSPDEAQSIELNALVDTGSFFTMVPASVLSSLGIKPHRTVGVTLADGRVTQTNLGEAKATINGESVNTLVLFGKEGTKPLLGAYTLEGLTLTVDPVNCRLIPTELITV